MYQYF